MRPATAAESMAWSKCVCTGITAPELPASVTEADAVQYVVDPVVVGSERPEPDLQQGGPREEPVEHDRRLAVVEQQAGHAEERHGEAASAAGTSKRFEYRPMSGRPSFSRMSAG